jgi:predicted glutamine amidotransferase
LLLDRLKEEPGDLVEATTETIRLVTRVCGKLGAWATLNLAVTDGERMAFARYATEGPGNSLYFAEDVNASPGAMVVASERLDEDQEWRAVPDRHLLVVEEGGASLRPL